MSYVLPQWPPARRDRAPLAAEIGTWTERTQEVSLLDVQLSTENPALPPTKINSVENLSESSEDHVGARL
jgi:hypothetical protein